MSGTSVDPLVARCRDALLAARVREPALRESASMPDPEVAATVAHRELGHHDRPGRHHHTRRHLAEVLAEVDRLVALDVSWGQVPLQVELAVLFHDVVYVPGRDDNEQRSAQHADAVLGELGVGRVVREEVTRLVLLTTTHDPGRDDPPGQLLVDGDLWILSSPRDRYDAYVRDVRAEYAGLDDAQWRRGRTDVLDRLATRLDRSGFLVGPSEDRARRTAAALANITRERRALHPDDES